MAGALLLVMLSGQVPWLRAADDARVTPPSPVSLDALQRERLEQGEVLVENIRQDESGGAVRVLALFATTAEQVWSLLGDCAANFRFVEGLLECEIMEQTRSTAITRQVAKKHWLAPRLAYRFETSREPYDWIRIRLLDGDLRDLDGSWLFEPGPRGLLVSHEIRVHPKVPAPRWLVRRTLQRDVPDMLACLRYIANGSLDGELAQADRARCPDH